jgi:hypothetical protein
MRPLSGIAVAPWPEFARTYLALTHQMLVNSARNLLAGYYLRVYLRKLRR